MAELIVNCINKYMPIKERGSTMKAINSLICQLNSNSLPSLSEFYELSFRKVSDLPNFGVLRIPDKIIVESPSYVINPSLFIKSKSEIL